MVVVGWSSLLSVSMDEGSISLWGWLFALTRGGTFIWFTGFLFCEIRMNIDINDNLVRLFYTESTQVSIRPKQKKDVVLPFRCQNMGRLVGNLFFCSLPLWADISQFLHALIFFFSKKLLFFNFFFKVPSLFGLIFLSF